MSRHTWRYIGKTENANIMVDYNTKKTKIITKKHIYIHNGIYPFQNIEPTKKYKR